MPFENFSQLQKEVHKFVSERKWEEFHNPKDLALAISVEANELLKMFVWKSDLKSKSDCEEEDFINKAADEIADVVILCASLANILNLNLGKIAENKLTKNEIKYPKNESNYFIEQWK